MAESTADVRRDIEVTRERMSATLAQLERKLNVVEVVKEHPWPALGVALAAGFALSATKADTKAAVATAVATKGASSRIGAVLDDLMANVMTGVHEALQGRIDQMVGELKQAIGAPHDLHRDAGAVVAQRAD